MALSKGGEERSTGIIKIDYKEWNNCYQIHNGLVKVIVSPSFGGRILYYGTDGRNLIADIFTLSDGTKESWGHQIDVVTEDKTNRCEPWWSDGYKIEIIDSYSIRLSSKIHHDYGVKLVKEITLLKGSTKLIIKNSLINETGAVRSWQLWNRSMLIPEGYAFFPLNSRSIFTEGWGLWESGKRSLEAPEYPYCRKLDNWLIIWARNPEPAKVGADSDAGWIGYVKDDLLYLRTYSYHPEGCYKSLHEGERISIAVYFADNRIEIEPQSPWFSLEKGKRYDFSEEWQLIKLKEKIGSFRKVLTLSPLVYQILEKRNKTKNQGV